MSFNSAFEAEMRRYQHEQITKPLACSLTSSQLNATIDQRANPNAYRRRRADDAPAKTKKRPFFLRKWFLLLAAGALGLTYASQAGYFQAFQNMSANVKASTGVDIMSAKTYKKLVQPPPERVEGQEMQPLISGDVHREYSFTNTMDMTKIETEARKLDEMAREFDKQFGNQPPAE